MLEKWMAKTSQPGVNRFYIEKGLFRWEEYYYVGSENLLAAIRGTASSLSSYTVDRQHRSL
jgi:hypothetical protein